MQIQIYQPRLEDLAPSWSEIWKSFIRSDYSIDSLDISNFEMSHAAWMSRLVSLIDLPKQFLFWEGYGVVKGGVSTLLAICFAIARLTLTSTYGIGWAAQVHMKPDYLPSFFKNRQFKDFTLEAATETIKAIKAVAKLIFATGAVALLGIFFTSLDLVGCAFPTLGKAGRNIYKKLMKETAYIEELNLAIEKVNQKYELQLKLISTKSLREAKKELHGLWLQIHPDKQAQQDLYKQVFQDLSGLIQKAQDSIKASLDENVS